MDRRDSRVQRRLADRVKAPMQRMAEAWGANICDAVAPLVPAFMRCSDIEPLHYVGYAAFAALVVLAAIVIWAGAR
jgi:hypothetical protein